MIYFITYIFSSVCAELGFRLEQRLYGRFLIIVALVVPSILAGCRDASIGVDRLVYGDYLFNEIANCSDIIHLDSRWDGWIESGYIWFNFFISRLSTSIVFFYFTHALLINSCVLASIKNIHIERYAGFSYGVFLFLFFQPSFNMIRQSLSASIILLGLSFFLSKKNVLAIICLGVGYFMHHSAIIALAFGVIVFFSQKDGNLKKIFIIDFLLFVFLITAGLYINNFLPYLNIDVGRYDAYFAKSTNSATTFNKSLFLLCLLLFIPIIKNWKEVLNVNKRYSLLIVVGLGLSFFSQIGLWGGKFIGRVVVFFQWTLVLLIPIILKYGKQQLQSKIIFAVYAFLYWWLYFIHYGYHQTYPYKSYLLGV